MHIDFFKYQGTGNDFVMLDNLSGRYNDLSISAIQFLCDRKLGVGADGLIKISAHPEYDFEVEYYNADGSQSFCGNGARCSVVFAQSLGVVSEDGRTRFLAIDGVHEAKFISSEEAAIEMLPVNAIIYDGNDAVINTGSPHYIRTVTEEIDIVALGRQVRFSPNYKQEGINVNSMEVLDTDRIRVRTYERGVEDETLSCGTGVTACALLHMAESDTIEKVTVETKGGVLTVSAQPNGVGFDHIQLTGPVKMVFNGSIDI